MSGLELIKSIVCSFIPCTVSESNYPYFVPGTLVSGCFCSNGDVLSLYNIQKVPFPIYTPRNHNTKVSRGTLKK